jgi:hypothetical protein
MHPVISALDYLGHVPSGGFFRKKLGEAAHSIRMGLKSEVVT